MDTEDERDVEGLSKVSGQQWSEMMLDVPCSMFGLTLTSYALSSVELRQGTVTQLLHSPTGRVTGVSYRTDTGVVQVTHAPLTVVCDGCFSALRTPLCKEDWKAKTTVSDVHACVQLVMSTLVLLRCTCGAPFFTCV